MKKKSFPAILVLLFLFLPSFARAGSLAAEDLLVGAKAYYEEGRYQQAIHEFSRVLLVDPYNKEAKEYLHKLGLQEGLYGRQVTPLQQVTQMGQEIVDYEGQLSTMAEENARQAEFSQQLQGEIGNMGAALQEKTDEADNLRQESAAIQKTAAEKVAQSEKVAAAMKAKADFKEKEVVRLHTDLYEMKARFLENQKEIEQKETALKQLQEKMGQELGKNTKAGREQQLQYKKQEIALKAELETLRHQAKMMEIENKKQIDGMREELVEKTNEADALHDRLVVANYKLANTENAIASKEREVLQGQDALSQMQARVLSLEDKLKAAGMQQKLGASSEVRTVDFLKKQDQQIAELKTQLLATKSELGKLRQSAGQSSVAETATLKQQLAEMSKQWKESKSLYEHKSEDYQIMEKRLKDLQERLLVVEGLLKSRDEQMKTLENQLDDDLLKMEQNQ